MKNYIKIASIALAMFSGMPAGSFAGDTDARDAYATDGHRVSRTETGSANQRLTDSVREEPNDKASLLTTMGEYAKMIGANDYFRCVTAYGAAYVGTEMFMEGTALGMYYLTYAGASSIAGPGAGAVAGSAAYTITTMVFSGLKWIPGVQGVVAARYTPTVRRFTDMAIDHGPAAVRTALSTGYSVAKATASVASMAQKKLSGISQYLYAL